MCTIHDQQISESNLNMGAFNSGKYNVPCMWRALFAPNLRSFSAENRAIFALEMLKISAIEAADARRTPAERSNNHFMHAAQAAQVILSSAVLFAPKSAGKLYDFA